MKKVKICCPLHKTALLIRPSAMWGPYCCSFTLLKLSNSAESHHRFRQGTTRPLWHCPASPGSLPTPVHGPRSHIQAQARAPIPSLSYSVGVPVSSLDCGTSSFWFWLNPLVVLWTWSITRHVGGYLWTPEPAPASAHPVQAPQDRALACPPLSCNPILPLLVRFAGRREEWVTNFVIQ